MSKAVEIEGYMLRVHTRHYDKVNGVIVCHKGENDKMFFPFRRPQGEWIPCSERLPERDELVLVSFKTGVVHLCKYLDDDSENPWWSYIDDCCAWSNVVNAWMPLPEPYKKEGDEK